MLTIALALAATASHEIPAEYYGVWDSDLEACTSALPHERLAVRSKEFNIYRDTFRVEKVRPRSDGSLLLSVSVRYHDSESGEFSQPYDVGWKLSDDGQQLTVSEGEEAITWRRCPGTNNQ